MKKNLGKILLIVLPVLLALYLLYPTYRSQQLDDLKNSIVKLDQSDSLEIDTLVNQRLKMVEVKPDELDKFKSEQRDLIIDSMLAEKQKVFDQKYGSEYYGNKAKRLKLGLDLRGGMYVILEVDVLKLIEDAAEKEAIDDVFEEVLDKTKKETVVSEDDVIDVFIKNFNQIAVPKRHYLSDYFTFGENATLDEADAQIIKKLRQNENEAIDRSMRIIRTRIDKYGVSEPTIQKIGSRRIMLELPGVNNEREMRNLIKTTARLEFNLVRNNVDLINSFYKIDELLSKQNARTGNNKKEEKAIKADTTAADTAVADNTGKEKAADSSIANSGKQNAGDTLSFNDSTGTDTSAVAAVTDTAKSDTADPYANLSDQEKLEKYKEQHPFTSLFTTYHQQYGYFTYVPQNRNIKGEYTFVITEDNFKKFMRIVQRPDVKELLPDGIKFLPEYVSDKDAKKVEVDGKMQKQFAFYALLAEPVLTGEVVTDAIATYDPTNNRPIVNMKMNSEGSEKWATITGQNLHKRIAIVLDGVVYSAPVVQSKITGGSSQITGMKDANEAKNLQIVLKSGALKAPVQIIQERVVGPSLGRDSIRSGLIASLIAFVLVILYMIMYYNKAGIIADFAVILNVLLIVAVLAAFQGTLTLPGIGGIILTIGMAVDANILIFERIREEMAKGRSLRSAVDEGFSKALSAIVDSNITTGITGFILFYLGTGPIQGFALTLIIGIFGTLFTGIMVSRAIIELIIARGATHFSFGQPKNLVQS